MSAGLAGRARQASAEIAAVFDRLAPGEVEAFVAAIAAARRIALYGMGREGLMMKALTMRLFHLGLDVHSVGDVTVPALGTGDLLIVSSGPGHLAMPNSMLEVGRASGARTAVVTAQPQSRAAGLADLVLHLPAQTMADDAAAAASTVLPMGSIFEGAQFLLFELVVLLLRERLGVTPEAMRARHTNLE